MKDVTLHLGEAHESNPVSKQIILEGTTPEAIQMIKNLNEDGIKFWALIGKSFIPDDPRLGLSILVEADGIDPNNPKDIVKLQALSIDLLITPDKKHIVPDSYSPKLMYPISEASIDFMVNISTNVALSLTEEHLAQIEISELPEEAGVLNDLFNNFKPKTVKLKPEDIN